MGKENKIMELQRTAARLRLEMVKMLKESDTPGAHYGGSLSVMEILTALYFHTLKIDPANPTWSERDRCILSKGHACAALCTILAERGYFPRELLKTFNHLDSPFGVHPDMHKIPGCDVSAGSLGHGLPIGVGMAMGAKLQKRDFRIYVVLSDGEMAEGSCWEAIMAGSHYGLSNLCGLIDRNGLSLDGPTSQTMTLEPLSQKIRSFGWNVIECNGHDIRQLVDGLEQATCEDGRPTMIVADTIKGKGISFLENDHTWHYGKFDDDQYVQVCHELEKKLQEIGA